MDGKDSAMRRLLFWMGWVVLSVLPVIWGIQIFMIKNFPPIEWWKWLVPLAAVMMIFFTRNRDKVLDHHIM
jgi:hypothetical protein